MTRREMKKSTLKETKQKLAHANLRRFQRYPQYKKSGVEWIGDIPKHWEIKKIKYSTQIMMGQSPNANEYHSDENGLPFLQGNAEFNTVNPTPRYYCESVSKIAPKNSILISVRAPVGALNIADQRYGIGRGLCAIVPISGLLTLSFSWFMMHIIREELYSLATGSTYDAVSVFDVSNLISLVPPIDEQKQIAAFLDRETSRIDRLIEKKRRLIELLKEKRTALISHAVTKGLNPDAPMQPSGIDWLGDVPEHWEVKKLKYISNSSSGSTPSKDNVEYWDGDIPWVSPKDMKQRFITDTTDHISQLALYEVNGKLIKENTLLIVVRSGILRHTLPVAINNVPLVINQDLKVIFPSKEIVSLYLYWLIEGHQKEFLKIWTKSGTTVESIETDYMNNSMITIPSIIEQNKIVDYLESKVGKIEKLINRITGVISYLIEYRTAIIAAAVTGKIDVRGEGDE